MDPTTSSVSTATLLILPIILRPCDRKIDLSPTHPNLTWEDQVLQRLTQEGYFVDGRPTERCQQRFPILSPLKHPDFFKRLESFFNESLTFVVRIQHPAKIEHPTKNATIDLNFDFTIGDLISKYRGIIDTKEIIGSTVLNLLGSSFLKAMIVDFFPEIDPDLVVKALDNKNLDSKPNDADIRLFSGCTDLKTEFLRAVIQGTDDNPEREKHVNRQAIALRNFLGETRLKTTSLSEWLLDRLIHLHCLHKFAFTKALKYETLGLTTTKQVVDFIFVQSTLPNRTTNATTSLVLDVTKFLEDDVVVLSAEPFCAAEFAMNLVTGTHKLPPAAKIDPWFWMRFLMSNNRILCVGEEKQMVDCVVHSFRGKDFPRYLYETFIPKIAKSHPKTRTDWVILTIKMCQSLQKYDKLSDHQARQLFILMKPHFGSGEELDLFFNHLISCLETLPFSEVMAFLQVLSFVFFPQRLTQHEGGALFLYHFGEREHKLSFFVEAQIGQAIQKLTALLDTPEVILLLFPLFQTLVELKKPEDRRILIPFFSMLQFNENLWFEFVSRIFQHRGPLTQQMGLYFFLHGSMELSKSSIDYLSSQLPRFFGKMNLIDLLRTICASTCRWHAPIEYPSLFIGFYDKIQLQENLNEEELWGLWCVSLAESLNPHLIQQGLRALRGTRFQNYTNELLLISSLMIGQNPIQAVEALRQTILRCLEELGAIHLIYEFSPSEHLDESCAVEVLKKRKQILTAPKLIEKWTIALIKVHLPTLCRLPYVISNHFIKTFDKSCWPPILRSLGEKRLDLAYELYLALLKEGILEEDESEKVLRWICRAFVEMPLEIISSENAKLLSQIYRLGIKHGDFSTENARDVNRRIFSYLPDDPETASLHVQYCLSGALPPEEIKKVIQHKFDQKCFDQELFDLASRVIKDPEMDLSLFFDIDTLPEAFLQDMEYILCRQNKSLQSNVVFLHRYLITRTKGASKARHKNICELFFKRLKLKTDQAQGRELVFLLIHYLKTDYQLSDDLKNWVNKNQKLILKTVQTAEDSLFFIQYLEKMKLIQSSDYSLLLFEIIKRYQIRDCQLWISLLTLVAESLDKTLCEEVYAYYRELLPTVPQDAQQIVDLLLLRVISTSQNEDSLKHYIQQFLQPGRLTLSSQKLIAQLFLASVQIKAIEEAEFFKQRMDQTDLNPFQEGKGTMLPGQTSESVVVSLVAFCDHHSSEESRYWKYMQLLPLEGIRANEDAICECLATSLTTVIKKQPTDETLLALIKAFFERYIHSFKEKSVLNLVGQIYPLDNSFFLVRAILILVMQKNAEHPMSGSAFNLFYRSFIHYSSLESYERETLDQFFLTGLQHSSQADQIQLIDFFIDHLDRKFKEGHSFTRNERITKLDIFLRCLPLALKSRSFDILNFRPIFILLIQFIYQPLQQQEADFSSFNKYLSEMLRCIGISSHLHYKKTIEMLQDIGIPLGAITQLLLKAIYPLPQDSRTFSSILFLIDVLMTLKFYEPPKQDIPELCALEYPCEQKLTTNDDHVRFHDEKIAELFAKLREGNYLKNERERKTKYCLILKIEEPMRYQDICAFMKELNPLSEKEAYHTRLHCFVILFAHPDLQIDERHDPLIDVLKSLFDSNQTDKTFFSVHFEMKRRIDQEEYPISEKQRYYRFFLKYVQKSPPGAFQVNPGFVQIAMKNLYPEDMHKEYLQSLSQLIPYLIYQTEILEVTTEQIWSSLKIIDIILNIFYPGFLDLEIEIWTPYLMLFQAFLEKLIPRKTVHLSTLLALLLREKKMRVPIPHSVLNEIYCPLDCLKERVDEQASPSFTLAYKILEFERNFSSSRTLDETLLSLVDFVIKNHLECPSDLFLRYITIISDSGIAEEELYQHATTILNHLPLGSLRELSPNTRKQFLYNILLLVSQTLYLDKKLKINKITPDYIVLEQLGHLITAEEDSALTAFYHFFTFVMNCSEFKLSDELIVNLTSLDLKLINTLGTTDLMMTILIHMEHSEREVLLTIWNSHLTTHRALLSEEQVEAIGTHKLNLVDLMEKIGHNFNDKFKLSFLKDEMEVLER